MSVKKIAYGIADSLTDEQKYTVSQNKMPDNALFTELDILLPASFYPASGI